MSILNQLANAQVRKDDVPNRELAKKIAKSQDREGIQALVDNLANADKAIQSDCIKTLYEVGYLDPSLIAGYWGSFLELLQSNNNRLVWGGMIALSTIAHLRAAELFPHAREIQQVVEAGSVITQDSGIRALAAIAAQRDNYRSALLPYLFEVLKTCRAKDLPRHAEVVTKALVDDALESWVEILDSRLPDLTASQQKRLKRTLKKARQA